VRIRRAGEEDLPTLADIFGRAGRSMAERYQPLSADTFGGDPDRLFPTWRHLLGTGACFLAEDPEPAGFATAVIRDGVWFLSHLWVVPERQGRGIGSVLVDEALAWGRGSSAFSVVASPDPAAQVVYLRRSMYPVWAQYEFTGPGGGEPPPGFGPLEEADVSWVSDLDREARGMARPEDHRFFQEAARGER
jgi:GNAT superfamily N-acetyltransferase